MPVVASDGSGQVVGILTRSDLLAAHEERLEARKPAEARYRVPGLTRTGRAKS